MLTSSILPVVLFIVCLIKATNGSQVISVTQFQTSTCADRESPDIFCLDCGTVAVCVKIGNVWQTYLVESCNAAQGRYCNEFEGGCSSTVGSCNPNAPGNFECNTVGVFPNPFNCRLYHMCFQNGNNLLAINVDCGGGVFSPATGDCSLQLNDPVCLTPQFNCTVLGQMGVWPTNNNIYYICAAEMVDGNRVLQPRLFRCPVNQMFQAGQCVQRDITNMPPGTLVPHDCERPGLSADPSHCQYYYSCSAALEATHLQCPAGTYFNANTLSCMLGEC